MAYISIKKSFVGLGRFQFSNRESYMRAHIFLNLLNKLGK